MQIAITKGAGDNSRLTTPCPYNRKELGYLIYVGSISCMECIQHKSHTDSHVNCTLPEQSNG